MAGNQESKRTILPPAEAEGAGNFGAEAGSDPTPSGGDQDIVVRSEMGTLTQPANPSLAGDIGNITGGEPPEEIAARRADSSQ